MASSAPNKSVVARAAAILTVAEVNATTFDLNESADSRVTVQIDFTIGSLTNGIFKFYVSADGTNWYSLYGATGATLTQTLTASGTIAIPVAAPGWKHFRVSVTGTGTVTSSTATVTHRYLRRGSQ